MGAPCRARHTFPTRYSNGDAQPALCEDAVRQCTLLVASRTGQQVIGRVTKRSSPMERQFICQPHM
eukprot:5197734-Alexandrium_andersonii.AAC.1